MFAHPIPVEAWGLVPCEGVEPSNGTSADGGGAVPRRAPRAGARQSWGKQALNWPWILRASEIVRRNPEVPNEHSKASPAPTSFRKGAHPPADFQDRSGFGSARFVRAAVLHEPRMSDAPRIGRRQ